MMTEGQEGWGGWTEESIPTSGAVWYKALESAIHSVLTGGMSCMVLKDWASAAWSHPLGQAGQVKVGGVQDTGEAGPANMAMGCLHDVLEIEGDGRKDPGDDDVVEVQPESVPSLNRSIGEDVVIEGVAAKTEEDLVPPAAKGGGRSVEDDGNQGLDVLDPDSLEVELGDHQVARGESGTGTTGWSLWMGREGSGVDEGDSRGRIGGEEQILLRLSDPVNNASVVVRSPPRREQRHGPAPEPLAPRSSLQGEHRLVWHPLWQSYQGRTVRPRPTDRPIYRLRPTAFCSARQPKPTCPPFSLRLCGLPSQPPLYQSGLRHRPDLRLCVLTGVGLATRDINIEATAIPVAVDHRISIAYYYRIADNLVRQANIYREEKNLLDLYIILLRYSSVETHECCYFVNELEALKPVVQQQIAELNRGVAEEPNGQNGTYVVTSRMDHLTQSSCLTAVTDDVALNSCKCLCRYSGYIISSLLMQPLVGSPTGLLKKPFFAGKHQVEPGSSGKPNSQLVRSYGNLPYPKEETLSRHLVLGPNGLHGKWTAHVAGTRIQYPSNAELTQSDISSLLPSILNPDVLYGPSKSQDFPINENKDMQSVLSLDDGRWFLPVEEPTSVSPGFEEEFSQLNIRQVSPPPFMAQVHAQHRTISTSTVADLGPGIATSSTGRYQNLHVPVTLMECFLRVAEVNTANNLETCGILAGTLKKRAFSVTTLTIPKQKSTSDSCQATNEEEIFEVQDKGSLFTVGWIHTHPTQTCFLSSIDLHNHYSYQVMLPEAIAIVMAPTDTTRKHGIFHLTDLGGMGVIHYCQESGFHPHEPLDGTSIYEHCSHVYMNPNVKFDMVDLRDL
uniref:MPN domain-containing protein n=1 Tax=Oryza brachyantha TaxID=4533 RepID=J3L087_ORYBR